MSGTQSASERFRARWRGFGARKWAPVVETPPSATCTKARDDAHKTSAIIPALKHRIPSELRSQACLGESSTRMGDPPVSPRVALLFAPERPEPLPRTSEAMVFGAGTLRDPFAVSLVGLGERFPDWGRNRDSEIVRESYDGFSVTESGRRRTPARGERRPDWGRSRDSEMVGRRRRAATSTWATDDARKTSAITPALKHRIPSELRS